MDTSSMVSVLEDMEWRHFDMPVRATTPHGTYVFDIVDIEDTPSGPLLRLREVTP